MKILIGLLFFIAHTTISTFGMYYMKAAPSWMSVKFFMGFSLYAAGAVMWMIILRNFPLSTAYPIASGCMMIGTTVTAYILLAEKIPSLHIFGIVLITFGIALIGLTLDKQ